MTKPNLKEVCEQLFLNSKEHHFKGYAPDDLLNSRRLSKLGLLNSEQSKLYWAEFGEKTSFNWRAILGVLPHKSARTIAYFLQALVIEIRRNDDLEYENIAKVTGSWLMKMAIQSDKHRYLVWSNGTNRQKESYAIDKNIPSLLDTLLVGQALLALGDLVQNPTYIQVGLNTAHYICEHLLCHGQASYFRVAPSIDAYDPVSHLQALAWVAQSATRLQDVAMRDLMIQMVENLLKAQNPDGSWKFLKLALVSGVKPGVIAGLGQILVSLKIIQANTNIEIPGLSQAILFSMKYYRVHCAAPLVAVFQNEFHESFELQGASSVFTMEDVSQLIIALIQVGNGASDLRLAELLMHASIAELYLEKYKRFAYSFTVKHRAFESGMKRKLVLNSGNFLEATQVLPFFAFSVYQNKINYQPLTIPPITSKAAQRQPSYNL